MLLDADPDVPVLDAQAMSDLHDAPRKPPINTEVELTHDQIRAGLTQWIANLNQDKYVHQVHEVTIREIDARDYHPNYVVLIPLGDVLGIQIKDSTDDANNYPNKVLAEVFVSMSAFASTLSALGLAWRPVCEFKESK